MANLRTLNYQGFKAASSSLGTSGWMFWSGSKTLTGSGGAPDTDYDGIGLEAVLHSESYFRYSASSAGSGLDIRTDTFFLGSNDAFLSGSGDGNIAISSSNFELSNTGAVTMQGSITATAGGTLGGWVIGTDILSASAGTFELDSNGPFHISSSGFQVDTAGAITASAGKIGGWIINDNTLSAPNDNISSEAGIFLEADAHPRIRINRTSSPSDNYINLFFSADSNWGIEGKEDGNRVFGLGNPNNSGNTIAGWAFDNAKLTSGPLMINSANAYISSSAGDGWLISSSADPADEAGFISSSLFKVRSSGQMTASAANIEGKITANEGEIAGWAIETGKLHSGPLELNSTNGYISSSAGSKWMISSSAETSDPTGFISSSQFKVSADGRMTASAGKIAGWQMSGTELRSLGYSAASKGIKLDGNSSAPTIDIREDGNNLVQMWYANQYSYGIAASQAGNTTFTLGSANQIAGWEFDNEKLQGGVMIIKKDGTIESDGFASNVPGTGFRLTAASGGFLEVENARIRGTLSTAVFEKEAVTAVGGQLYVANSTTLTGSVFPTTLQPSGYTSSEYPPNETTMSVVNVTGFANGEILSAKKMNSTGFATEYMKVISSSRYGDAENDLTGAIYVERGLGTSFTGTSGSLGDSGSSAQSYSGSQVIVSTGKLGTGYIRLNANPNDPYTPYIDIVERTGSDVYDVDLKARLGDLSGVTDSKFSDGVSGYGLYTQNGYFSGKIEVASLPALPTTTPTYHYDFNVGAGTIVYNTVGQDLNDISGSIVNANECWVSGSGNFITGGTSINFEAGKGTRIEIEDREWYYPGGSTTPIHSASISVWVKPEDVSHEQPQIVWESGGGSNGDALYISGSHIWWTAWEGSSNSYDTLKVSASIESNVWTHVAASRYHGTASIYINGVHQATETGHPDIDSGGIVYSGYTGIGATHNDSAIITSSFRQTSGVASGDGLHCYTGSIDELRVFGHYKLTDNEISALYQSPAGTVGGTTVIEGGRIKTGKVQSTNYGASAGSELDLDNGTIKLGGSSAPDFAVDETGALTASAGTIAGWTIASDKLSKNNAEIDSAGSLTLGTTNDIVKLDSQDGTYRLWAGNATAGSAPFSVTKAGVLAATGANISGDITVTGGQLTASIMDFPSEENLIGYYPLHNSVTTNNGNDRVLDYSGNDYHGEDDAGGISGGTTFVTGTSAGPLPGAAEFDGTDSRIDINALKAGLTNNMDISLSFWIYNDVAVANVIPFGFHDGSANDLIWTMDDGGTNNLTELHTNGTSLGTVSSTLEFTDNWRHVVLTIPNGGAAKIYVDGQLMGSYSTANADLSAIADVDEILLGGELDSAAGDPTNDLTGKMSEFRVYNTELTADNARALFNLPAGPNSAGTTISGDKITTGKIHSNNWAASAGSQLDLDNGIIRLGGSSSPSFQVDQAGALTASAGKVAGWTIGASSITSTTSVDGGSTILKSNGQITASSMLLSGSATATNFATKVVTVDAGNLSSYRRANGGGYNLVFDGSQGGERIMHMILDTDPGLIKGFDLVNMSGSVESQIVIDVTTTVTGFDDGINTSMAAMNAAR